MAKHLPCFLGVAVASGNLVEKAPKSQLVARFPTQRTEQSPFVDATGTIDTCGTDEERVRVVGPGQARRE